MKTLLEKKKVVLTKFYGGKRLPYYHNFRLTDGVCFECGTFIGDADMKICKVITRDEVALFRNTEDFND